MKQSKKSIAKMFSHVCLIVRLLLFELGSFESIFSWCGEWSKKNVHGNCTYATNGVDKDKVKICWSIPENKTQKDNVNLITLSTMHKKM